MIDGTLVLAAGKSTRIASISGGRPKPLLNIGGRPVIARNLSWLVSQGIHEAWINLHHEPDRIVHELGTGDKLGIDLYYSYEPTILGTAGAWRNLSHIWGSTTLVVYGDSLVRLNLAAMTAAHEQSNGALATIAVFDPLWHVHTSTVGGRLSVDLSGRVERFAEFSELWGNEGNYVSAGVYLLNERLLKQIPGGFVDFAHDVFPNLARDRLLSAWVMESDDYCLGIDTPEMYMMAQTIVQKENIIL